MESEDLVIVSIWIFVIVVTIAVFWVGESYVTGIGGPYVASFLLFIIALISSAVVLPRKK